jgi:small subunit ribosomal protein S4
MARYTGLVQESLVNLAKAIFGDDKAFEKEITLLGNTGWLKKRGKKSEFAIWLMEKQKLNILRNFRKQFRGCSKKHQLPKVLLVRFYYSCVKQD